MTDEQQTLRDEIDEMMNEIPRYDFKPETFKD